MSLLTGVQGMQAQTVSVGSASSSTSGTTTTVTIPVTVSTPAPAAATTSTAGVSSMAILDVTAGTGDGTQGVQTLGQSFGTISLPTAVVDSASGWNATTSTYTVPTTGLYSITTKMRVVDSTAPGINYGVGASTANGDGPFFIWATTAGLRNGLMNTRLQHLNKGDQVRMFSYVDFGPGARLSSAEMIIEQVQ